ncbi:MAG: RNA polymerase sigma factor [Verrucomicrobia bacterium]|nr:RNA polymerase sigma factor [Verrucomicrobiota bacterium]
MNSIVSEPRTERECPDEPQAGLGSSEFAALYTEHSRAVYYLCLRLLSDPDKAEDATHDVFLKAFRKMNQFRGESSWRTWLYRIAINHCHNLNQFRGESSWRTWLYRIAINHCHNLHAAWHDRHMLTNADEAVWETTPAQTDSPFRVLETKELGERIQKTLDGLPPEYRLLLLLVADKQLSYEQVGTLTEQSTDAVRGKLHRARKAFAVLFQKTA